MSRVHPHAMVRFSPLFDSTSPRHLGRGLALGLAFSLVLAFTVLAASSDTAWASTARDFADTDLSAWKERELSGNTRYRLVDRDGVRSLEAATDGSASILYRKQRIDLDVTPVVEWSWQVGTLFDGIDQQSKQGDDFPARLYVVARLGSLPWQTLALNYVWTSSIPEGTVWLNPFTEKAAMIAVQSGASDLGEWVIERRNVADDFKLAFGRDIDEIAGFAVMADGDNSSQQATSYFGRIEFVAP